MSMDLSLHENLSVRIDAATDIVPVKTGFLNWEVDQKERKHKNLFQAEDNESGNMSIFMIVTQSF